MNFYDVLAAEKWGGGIPTINFFELLFAQSMGGAEQWKTYEGTLPATLNANGDDMRQYQVYGNTGGVGDRTENYLQVTPDMYIAANWEEVQYTPTDPTKYFMYFELPKATKDILAHLEEVYANVYLIGTHYNFLVFAITDDKYGSVATEYRIIQNNGDILSWAKDVSNWEHIYLCIGYGQGIIAANKQTLINAFFDNYNLSLTEGATPPETFVPFGYEVDMVSRTRNLLDYRTVQNNLTVDAVTGLPTGFNGRIATLTPIDVSTVSAVTITYNSNYIIYFMYSVLMADNTMLIRKISKLSGDTIEIPAGGAKLYISWYSTFSITTDVITQVMVSVNPSDEYQPYYNMVTPIYIGDDPLEEDEYVDYKAQKVYRMIDGTLTPTDPPVPLPALPTCEGTTVIDYAGQSVAPEKVYFEYQGGKQP